MTGLTDRMRTAAAALAAADLTAYRIYENVEADAAVKDAVDLLLEASNALESCVATGEACVPLPKSQLLQEPPAPTPGQLAQLAAWEADVVEGVAKQRAQPQLTAAWIDGGHLDPKPNPTRNLRSCPRCDSRAAKRADLDRAAAKIYLTCPACSHRWPFP